MNIQASSQTSNKMSFEEAVTLVHHSVEMDARRAERDAEYYEESHNPDPDNFSHAFAAKSSREKAYKLREAFQVLTRGY